MTRKSRGLPLLFAVLASIIICICFTLSFHLFGGATSLTRTSVSLDNSNCTRPLSNDTNAATRTDNQTVPAGWLNAKLPSVHARTPVLLGGKSLSDAWLPVIYTNCQSWMPKSWAPCLSRQLRTLEYGEQIVYPGRGSWRVNALFYGCMWHPAV